jgi:arsenate reductase-like glutaredoxin family protein
MSIDNITKLKIQNILKCSLCSSLLYQPVTLHCQDTFCRHCLKNYEIKTKKQDCPKCHNLSFYQPINNFKIWDLINKLFPNEVKAREEEIKKFSPKLTEVEEIKEEIIKNNWRDVVNKKSNQSNQLNQLNLNQQNQHFQILADTFAFL